MNSLNEQYDSNVDIKDTMENTRDDDKEKHLNYRIVNRSVKFNENGCQRINETSGNISKVSKAVVDRIKELFDILKEKTKNDIEGKELEKQIAMVKREILRRKEELKRIKIKSNSGYIAIGSILVITIILLSVTIFTIVGTLLR